MTALHSVSPLHRSGARRASPVPRAHRVSSGRPGPHYAETADLLARWVTVLRAGLEPGQGIGMLSPNRPEVWLGQSRAVHGRRPLHRAPPARLARRSPLRVRRGRAALPPRRSRATPSARRGCSRASASSSTSSRSGPPSVGEDLDAARRRRDAGAARRRARTAPRTSRGCSTPAARPASRRPRCCPERAIAQMVLSVLPAGTCRARCAISRARRSRTRPAC